MTPILIKFQSKVNDFVFARKTEKDDLMKDIQTSLSRPSSNKPNRPPPPPGAGSPSTSATDGAGIGAAPSYTPAPNQTPYPTNNFQSPYFPAMPNAFYPYSFIPGQQGHLPPAAPQYYPGAPQPGYPPQYPHVPPKK